MANIKYGIKGFIRLILLAAEGEPADIHIISP